MTVQVNRDRGKSSQAIFTPALNAILECRYDQIINRRHDAATDDAAGPAPLITMARSKILKTLQTMMRGIEHEQQACSDMAIGRVDCLSKTEHDLLYRRLAASAALCLAAMDVLDRSNKEGET